MIQSTEDALFPPRQTEGAFLKTLKIKNFKSIGKCSVDLRSLSVLVGRNGSGKSNFLDALRFVVDGLQTSLDHAIKSRGGIDAVRRRSTGHPRNFAIELTMNLPEATLGTYGFEIAARPQGGFVVKQERLEIRNGHDQVTAKYHVKEAQIVDASLPNMPAASADRLYLVNTSGLPQFRPTYDALVSMGFYNLNPDAMKELQSPDAGELLHRDGANIPSVIARLRMDKPGVLDRVRLYLEKIVPGISEVNREQLGPKETLEFRQKVAGSAQPWRFYAASMSDGTLRALGMLVAASQLAERKNSVRLVGIEEPETALHPAAAGALLDAIREAAAHTQVIITTHSPDLLDHVNPTDDAVLTVVAQDGNTSIAPLDPASREAIRSHLYTAGSLLRMDQLEPDQQDLERQKQLELFDGAEDIE